MTDLDVAEQRVHEQVFALVYAEQWNHYYRNGATGPMLGSYCQEKALRAADDAVKAYRLPAALADRDGKREPAKCGGCLICGLHGGHLPGCENAGKCPMCHGRKRVGRGWADDEPCPACNGAGLAPGAGAKTLDAGTGADGVCAPAGDVLTAGPAPVPVHLLELSNSCGVVCGCNGSLCRRVSRHGGKHRAKLDDETIIEWRKAPSPPPEPSPRHSEGCPLRKGNYTVGNCTCSAYPAPSEGAPEPSPRGMPEAEADGEALAKSDRVAADVGAFIPYPKEPLQGAPVATLPIVLNGYGVADEYVRKHGWPSSSGAAVYMTLFAAHVLRLPTPSIEPRGGTGANDDPPPFAATARDLQRIRDHAFRLSYVERNERYAKAEEHGNRALYNAGRASRDATVDEFIEWVRAWCHSPNEMSKAPDRIAELRKELEKR